MRYSKSMIEAVQQVGLYEMMDYAIIDGDNKIIGLYKGNMAKKQAQLNLKGAERQVGIKKPLKVIPVSKKKKGDTVIGIGELTDKDREAIDEKVTKTFGVDFEVDAPDEKPVKTGREPHVKIINKLVKKHKLRDFHADDLSKFNVKDDVGGKNITKFFADMVRAGLKVINKKITDNYTSKSMGESNLNEDVKNALAGFDNRIKDGGMDRKDLIKAKELYKRKDVKRLRQHIYSLDTAPLETIMNLISIQDRPFFDKMYPNTRGGEFLAKIAYDHRKLDENLDENKDDEKKRMKGAKLKLKMGDALDERMEKGIDKLPRQFLNPDKEVMVMKKNKVIVIDKKDQDRYTKQGWELAEVLDKEDEPKVKEVIKKLKGASKAHAGQAKDLEKAVSETTITGKDLLENKYKEEKNGAQHFSKIEEDNYVWNFVYDDFGRTKLTTEPDKATHLVYTMEGKDNPQLLKISEKEILDYKKGETNEVSKK